MPRAAACARRRRRRRRAHPDHRARRARQAGGDAADLLGRLAVQEVDQGDALGVLNRLLALAAERTATELEAEAKAAGQLAPYQPSISYLRNEIIKLRELPPIQEAESIFESLEPLLQWLVEYSEEWTDE